MSQPTPPARLLAINNYFYRRGGAESVFLDHMDMFAKGGWDVVPFAMNHPQNLPSEWSSFFVPEIEYGRQHGLMTKLEHAVEVIYSRKARRNLAALLEKTKPSIAHAHNVYHHLSPSIFPLLKAEGIPTVMTVHDLKLACPAYKMLSKGRICEKCKGGRIHNLVLNRCMKDSLALSAVVLAETVVHRALRLYRDHIDRLVVPSRFYREKLIEWGWPAEKLIHIPNFIESAAGEPEPPEEGGYFLFAGRLAPEKGIATLIHAAARAGERLVIAGTGPEEEALRATAEETGADVTFAGYLTGEPLKRTISGAKALVLPSEWYENAPVSLLEAYALDRPVIGARIGGIPELIEEGETGLIAAPGNAEDLARTLSAMSALTPAQRLEMGRTGRHWARRDFSAEAYFDRTRTLYASLGVG